MSDEPEQSGTEQCDHPDEHTGYGLDYTGSGFRCPKCEFIGTYLTCSECGHHMEGPDHPRYRGSEGER